MLSEQLRKQLLREIDSFEKELLSIVEIGKLNGLKISVDFSEAASPKMSTKISMFKSDSFFVENGNVPEASKVS